jgi:hypothetical protein
MPFVPLTEARIGHLQRAVAVERSRLDSLLKAAEVRATKKRRASVNGGAVPPDAVDSIGCGLATIVCIARDVAASAGRSTPGRDWCGGTFARSGDG